MLRSALHARKHTWKYTIKYQKYQIDMARYRLITAIKTCIESEGITQREVAERFNVAQPRISEIYQGKIELFSADKLINMLARVGRHVDISINARQLKWGRTTLTICRFRRSAEPVSAS